MNWDAISAVSQIIGVIVVVVTLIYLAAQVRQGNVFAKLQARQRMIEQQESELRCDPNHLTILPHEQ